MLKEILGAWREDRAEVVTEFAWYVLDRYQRRGDQRALVEAFNTVMTRFEREFEGKPSSWTREQQAAAASAALNQATERRGARRSGAAPARTEASRQGAALCSLYIELHTLPGHRAQDVIVAIEQWRRSAA